MATTLEPLHWKKRNFVQWKIVNMPTSSIWLIIYFNGTFEYGDGGIFKTVEVEQNLHSSTWGHTILYTDRS
jgi:hypothetical protein